MQVRMLVTMPASPGALPEHCRTDARGHRWLDAGTVISRDDAHLLIVHGAAEPYDEASRKWLDSQTPEQVAKHGEMLAVHLSLEQQREEVRAEEIAASYEDEGEADDDGWESAPC